MLKTNGTISVGAGHPTSNFYSGADDLVVANFAQDTGISIMSGTSNEANVAFGSTTFGSGAIQARLYYDSGNDKLVMNSITTGHNIEIKSGGTITLGDANNPTITIDDMSVSGSNYGVEVDGTIYPKITGAAHSYRDLGLSGVRWTNVYATNLHGDGSNITNVGGTIPSGGIVLWSGAADAIPSGWVLCNGSNSTPDLRGRFVVGYSDTDGDYDVGDTGGAKTDTVNISVSGTTGTQNAGSNGTGYLYGDGSRRRHTHNFSGSGSDTVNTRPPYYALCYIMKT